MKLVSFLAFLSLAMMINCYGYDRKGLESGVYYIKSEKFGTYVDTCGSDSICPYDPDNLFVNNFYGDAYQRFTVTKLKDDYYVITAAINGKNIETRYSYKPSKTLFLAYADNYDQDQQFRIVNKGYNTYVLIPRELADKAVEAPKYELEELFLGKSDNYNKAQRFVFERYYEKPVKPYGPYDAKSGVAAATVSAAPVRGPK